MLRNVIVSAGFLLVVLLAPGAARTATYFVDANLGNDACDGLRAKSPRGQQGPFKTIARVNRADLRPGDSVYFNRGDTWTETLDIPSGGIQGRPVTIGAYGDGKRPLIDVRNEASSAITCSRSYVTIQDLSLANSKHNALGVACKGGCRGITIRNMDIRNAGKNAVSIANGGNAVHIDNVSVFNASNNGIHLGGSLENKLSNVVVENCHISGVGANDGVTIHEDGDQNTAGSNFVLRNNYAENCAEQGFDITTGEHVLLLNNSSANNKEGGVVIGHSARHVTIDRHRSRDEPTKETSAAILIGGERPHACLVNSIIQGSGYHLLCIKASDVKVLHNHFVWNGGAAMMDLSGRVDDIQIKNNIFTTRQDKMGRIRFLEAARPPNHKSFDFDHNLYFAPNKITIYSASTKESYSFAEYQAAYGVEMQSREIDPRFVDRAGGNYRLKRTSPAIDAGVDVGVKEDAEGQSRPCDGNEDGTTAPDIGADEFHPAPGREKAKDDIDP